MRKLILLTTVVAVILLIGCESKEELSEERELLLYCGAGIRPPADELAETFNREQGVKIIIDYAGSEVLLSKMKLVRRGDLYMPGDKYYVDQAGAEGMILTQRSVCYFVPTILVQKGNPKDIRGLRDLLRPGLKLGFGDSKACAIGRTTRKILARNEIAWKEIEKNLVYQSLTVNELGMQIQAKALDAVIVWDAMAHYYSKHGEQVPIPVGKNVISTVDVGVLKFSKDMELAQKFVDFISSKQGRDIFKKHSYTVEPPE